MNKANSPDHNIEFDVFLSRKTVDQEMSLKVYHFLKQQGLKVFDASVSLPEIGIADYSKAIDIALDHCKHLVVVTSSSHHPSSSWVEAEWRFYLNKKRGGKKMGNILCVVSPDVIIEKLPPSLQNFEVIPIDNMDRLLPYVVPKDHVKTTPIIENYEIPKINPQSDSINTKSTFVEPDNEDTRKLRKSKGMVFGVCSGIAKYFDFDVVFLRGGFLLTFYFIYFITLPTYLILALFLKKEPRSGRR